MRSKIVCLLTSVLLASCLTPNEEAALKRAAEKGGSQIDIGTGPVLTPGAEFALNSPATQTYNLFTTNTVQMQIQAANSFNGMVDLTVEFPELQAIDTLTSNKDAILVTVSPARVTLTAGQTTNFTVTTKVTEQAASFNGEHFHVVAKKVGSATGESSTVMLNVAPILSIPIDGTISAARTDYTKFPTSTVIRGHVGGVQLRFCNLDAATGNIIHGNNSIPHQNVGQPMSTSPAAGVCGNVQYATTITPPAAGQKTGSFYLHNDGATGPNSPLVRNMIFLAN